MDILDYDDYRAFVEAWRSARPDVSDRDFAKRVGKSDSSLLLRIISGQRGIPRGQVDAYASALELDGVGREVLHLLVEATHAPTEGERSRAQSRLEGMRAYQRARTLASADAYRTWVRPVLHELASCAGYIPDATWIAERVLPQVQPEEIRDALDANQDLANGVLVAGDEVHRREVFQYYRGIHRCVADALDSLESDSDYVELSQFLSLTVAVPESKLPDLRRRLLEMWHEIVGDCEIAEGPRERVMQVNLQLFPLTERVPNGTTPVPDGTAPEQDLPKT